MKWFLKLLRKNSQRLSPVIYVAENLLQEGSWIGIRAIPTYWADENYVGTVALETGDAILMENGDGIALE